MKALAKLFLFAAFMASFFAPPLNAEELYLRDNFQHAKAGDFIVVSASKTHTLMHIAKKENNTLSIEEIAVPQNMRPLHMSWKEWVRQGAPGHSSWVTFNIDLKSGKMVHYYSYTKKNWYEIPEADNFLTKLLNLKFIKIHDQARKRIGPKARSGRDMRPTWQPQMKVDGQIIKGITFDAWRARWPRDGSDLSGKTIEVFLPSESDNYPAYFPYWLQINGAIGKAKIRIIDSGSKLQSPRTIKIPN